MKKPEFPMIRITSPNGGEYFILINQIEWIREGDYREPYTIIHLISGARIEARESAAEIRGMITNGNKAEGK